MTYPENNLFFSDGPTPHPLLHDRLWNLSHPPSDYFRRYPRPRFRLPQKGFAKGQELAFFRVGVNPVRLVHWILAGRDSDGSNRRAGPFGVRRSHPQQNHPQCCQSHFSKIAPAFWPSNTTGPSCAARPLASPTVTSSSSWNTPVDNSLPIIFSRIWRQTARRRIIDVLRKRKTRFCF